MSTANAEVGGIQAALEERLKSALEARVFSAAQLEIGDAKGAWTSFHLGKLSEHAHSPATEPQTPFDIASLTKVFTALLAMMGIHQGRFRLDSPLTSLLPGELPASLQTIQLQQLLAHRAGLAPWRPFFEDIDKAFIGRTQGRDDIRQRVLCTPLDCAPGQAMHYSDLGYILLAWILEEAFECALDTLVDERLVKPLGLAGVRYVNHAAGAQPLCAAPATESVSWRGGLVHGLVHDGNTYAMGGVSGHAGLFASAKALGRLAQALLEIDQREAAHPNIDADLLRHAWEARFKAPGSYSLGWDRPSGPQSNAGPNASPQTVGHLGFTGCSLWIDRSRGKYVVLLTNRVHPTRDNPRIKALRRELHELAWRLCDAHQASLR